MGWRRSFRYIRHRIVRLSASSRSIALGLSIGILTAFSPLVGTHFIQAALFSYIFRANILAALIGTFVGNPWTYPLIWWGSIQFGAFLFEIMNLHARTKLPVDLDFATLWHIITHQPYRLFLPWMLGGYALGLMAVPLSYAVLYPLVRAAKTARARARQAKMQKKLEANSG